MSEKVYKKIRVTGCSDKSIERAIEAAVERASKSVHGMGWFELTEIRGAVKDGGVIRVAGLGRHRFQAGLRIRFSRRPTKGRRGPDPQSN